MHHRLDIARLTDRKFIVLTLATRVQKVGLIASEEHPLTLYGGLSFSPSSSDLGHAGPLSILGQRPWHFYLSQRRYGR